MIDALTRIYTHKPTQRRDSLARNDLQRRTIAVCLIMALLNLFSPQVSRAAVVDRARMYGEVIVGGVVKVDGMTAISGQTIFSGNSITTARRSIATVIPGKLGRLELQPDSKLTLSFEEASLTGRLDAGMMRLSIPAGVATMLTTKGATVITDESQPATFSISVDDNKTIVTAQAGRVYLHAGGQTQLAAAGQTMTASSDGISLNSSQPPPGATREFSGGRLAAFLLAVGGAVATAIVVFTGRDRNIVLPVDEGGCVIVPSGESPSSCG